MALRFFAILLVGLVAPSIQKTKDEWKTRTIYQLLTDRFARTDGSKADCGDLSLRKYCGGSFKGITNNLDYISGMGFDAIWISPVVDNYPSGYHGYYARNIYQINSNFGTSDDLKELVKACHDRDIWVMVDVVANHMGNFDENYEENYPFSEESHYHDYCIISDDDFNTYNLPNIQNCRLASLADLNSENPYVQDQLIKWIKWLVTEFNFDGLRLDTLIEVPPTLWKRFTDASGVFSVGEGSSRNMTFVSQYVGYVDSILNFPQFHILRDIFLHQRDMIFINRFVEIWENIIGDKNRPYLGNFNDNHDQPRFLSSDFAPPEAPFHGSNTYIFSKDRYKLFRTWTAYQMMSIGIPIIYYGTEQAFYGGNDPYDREPLWTNFDPTHEMYTFLKTINQARKITGAASQPQIDRFSDYEVFAFTRGDLFAAFTSKINRFIHKLIAFHPYDEDEILCNIFNPSDCVRVIDGKFDLYLSYGDVKILMPQRSLIQQH